MSEEEMRELLNNNPYEPLPSFDVVFKNKKVRIKIRGCNG
jgi:hypothetical protein